MMESSFNNFLSEGKHIVCFSGGHSSALVAIYCVDKYGKDNVILLNHNIKTGIEPDDIKRFKKEVANYLGLPITYANYKGIEDADEIPDQFDVCMENGTAITSPTGHALCTAFLKTIPFEEYLRLNFFTSDNLFEKSTPCVIYYGFDKGEETRMTRRSSHLGAMGYKTDYPIALRELRITDTNQIGIKKPNSYELFKHANCIGCLKAGLLHWYVTYCIRYDIYVKGIMLEDHVSGDYTIHRVTRNGVTENISLLDLEPIFDKMKKDGIPATEHQSDKKFGRLLRKYQIEAVNINKPCECTI